LEEQSGVAVHVASILLAKSAKASQEFSYIFLRRFLRAVEQNARTRAVEVESVVLNAFADRCGFAAE
jgi:hypothetical protein